MVYQKTTKIPLIFHVKGAGQNERVVTPSVAVTSFHTLTSLYTNRFSMFQNLQNTKPCGSCGGR